MHSMIETKLKIFSCYTVRRSIQQSEACSFLKQNPKYQQPIQLSCNFSIRTFAHVQFYKRQLEFSTKTSYVRVNHLLATITFSQGLGNFLIAISNDLNKKNRVLGYICLSGKVEMIDFNPTPFIVLSHSKFVLIKASFLFSFKSFL